MFNEKVKVKYLISSPILLVSTRSSSEPNTQLVIFYNRIVENLQIHSALQCITIEYQIHDKVVR